MGFLVAGSEMVSFTLIGLLGDYVAGTMPVFTVILTLIGVGMAFFQLVQMSRKLAKQNKVPKKD
jgi:F0F1-type ATP synthase assembly protein I